MLPVVMYLLILSKFLVCSDDSLPSALPYGLNDYQLVQRMNPEDLSELALSNFIRRTDSDVARYIKPHLVSVIKEATSSPDNDDDNSPDKVVKRWSASPDLVRHAPRHEIDEIVLKAVEKAFKEKEETLRAKDDEIENMFSKKTLIITNVIIGGIVSVITAFSSVFGTKDNCK